MLDKLDTMIGFHRQVLNIRDTRQRILAVNIANSDTPNYQARDIDFNAELNKALHQTQTRSVSSVALTATNPNHIALNSLGFAHQNLLYRIPYQSSADGNTVDMDTERVEMMDNSVRYQSGLTFLGAQFKNLSSVLQQG